MTDLLLKILLIELSIVFILMPNHIILTLFLLPIIVLSDFLSVFPVVASFGEADIRIQDIIILTLGIKTALVTLKRREFPRYQIYLPIGVFVSTLFIATNVSFFRFGSEIFLGQLVALLRMSSQFVTFFILVLSLHNQKEVNTGTLLDISGFATTAIIYFNAAFAGFGVMIGEVQETSLTTRYFGPIGDQVGYILLFFVFKKIVERKTLMALWYSGAILATGTRGSLIALAVGLTIIGFEGLRHHVMSNKRYLALLTAFAFLAVGAFLYDFGGIQTRIFDSAGRAGLYQRLLTAEIALRVFADNPVIGVGFTGFRYFALTYGAWELFYHHPVAYFADNMIATTANQYLQIVTDAGILGLAAFIWMVTAFLRVLHTASYAPHGQYNTLFLAGKIWLLALLFGNQTASWFLPGSLVSLLLLMIVGLATVATTHQSSTTESLDTSSSTQEVDSTPALRPEACRPAHG